MIHDDVISLKAKKDERPVVSVSQAKASLARGLKAMTEFYGFELSESDPRFSIVGTRREGDKAIVTYGAKGRRLDAAQLAYELNN